jgi:hypothetical protein
VLTNVYNEEYLLPFWLEHHKRIFDHGIIIDYRSTDNSMDIVRRICPTWTIITTRNSHFDAKLIDEEFMDIERSIEGYKIILNTTEFLIGPTNIRYLLRNSNNCAYGLKCLTPFSSQQTQNPANLYELLSGIERVEEYSRFNRFIHSYPDGAYTVGRHQSYRRAYEINMYIMWFGYYPWNQQLIDRKLQIKRNISESDKLKGYGSQHLLEYSEMTHSRQNIMDKSIELDRIDDLTTYIKSHIDLYMT